MNRNIKNKSFDFIKNNFKENLILALILLVFTFLSIGVSSLQSFGSTETQNSIASLISVIFFITSLLSTSLTWSYFKINNNKEKLENNVTQSILPVKYYWKLILLNLLLGILVWVIAFVAILLIVLFFVSGGTGVLLSVLLIFALLFVGIYVSIRLSQADLLMLNDLYQDNQDGYWSYYKKSWNMMKGHTGEYLGLMFSLTGWYLLIMVTLGIANIFVVPYISNIKGNYFRYILESVDE